MFRREVIRLREVLKKTAEEKIREIFENRKKVINDHAEWLRGKSEEYPSLSEMLNSGALLLEEFVPCILGSMDHREIMEINIQEYFLLIGVELFRHGYTEKDLGRRIQEMIISVMVPLPA